MSLWESPNTINKDTGNCSLSHGPAQRLVGNLCLSLGEIEMQVIVVIVRELQHV